MKHTTESLAAMSDFDRNEVLAELLGLQIAEEQHFNFGDRLESALFIGNPKDLSVVDYCSNPSDVMPLVFENKLSIVWADVGTDEWLAGSMSYHRFYDTNPLRAAACCLILVLQEEKQYAAKSK